MPGPLSKSLAASHSSKSSRASVTRQIRGRLGLTAFGALWPLLGACHPQGDGGGHHGDPTASDGVGAPGQAFVLTYDIPEGHTSRDFAVIGQLGVTLGDGAQARAEDDSFAALANVGEQPFELQKGAEIGAAISIGDAVLAKGSRVHGDVTTAGSVRGTRYGSPGTIDGTTTEHAEISVRHIERSVTFPGTMAPSQRIPNSASTPEETLSPGYYESLFVKDEGRVSLPSGEYYFDVLNVGSRATLVLEDGGGPITIYVRERLEVEGGWEHESSDVAQVTLVYLGTQGIRLTQPFEGTLIAPRAKLELLDSDAAPELPPTGKLRSGAQGPWQRGWSPGKQWASNRDHEHDDRDRGDGHQTHDDGHHGHGYGHRHHHHHHHGHGHGHDQDPPTDEGADYIGTFIGLDVVIGKGVTLVHHPIQPERGPAAGGRFFTFEFPLPGGVSPEEVDLGGIAGVDIGDGVSLEPGCNPGSARATTSASGPTTVGVRSQLGSIVSVGAVRLAGSTSLSGAVSSGGDITASGASIGGAQQANASLDDFRTLRWNVTFPGGALPDLQLEAGRARVLYPEVYGKVSLAAGATLYLRSGTYHFGSLLAAAGSSIVLESSGGPVVVNVENELRLEGAVSGLGGVTPQLFIGYAGSRTAFVGGSFSGTLVAPRARVSLLGGSHQGQVLARTVNVD
ncbi:MAG TPA: hypothetical protein VJU61_09310, partial [Polyangiaceae bacterium]|nr:hypothetical protein [Polyangiaceae bacterium]